MAVFGGNYGGYETLVAMTLTPGVFACGDAVVGPSEPRDFRRSETLPPIEVRIRSSPCSKIRAPRPDGNS